MNYRYHRHRRPDWLLLLSISVGLAAVMSSASTEAAGQPADINRGMLAGSMQFTRMALVAPGLRESAAMQLTVGSPVIQQPAAGSTRRSRAGGDGFYVGFEARWP